MIILYNFIHLTLKLESQSDLIGFLSDEWSSEIFMKNAQGSLILHIESLPMEMIEDLVTDSKRK